MLSKLTAALAFVGFVAGQVPIPNRPDGFPLGGAAGAPIVLESFFDLLCPDSRAAWPVIQQVVQHYASNLHFRLHTFPLPYHTWSFIANQGAHYVGTSNSTAAYAWTEAVFAAQESFGNSATSGQTRDQVIASFAALAEKNAITTSDLMTNGLNDPNVDWNTRVSWKYGCSRSVSGTPSFLVNGVAVQADPSWSLSQWQSVLDPLIASLEKKTSQQHHHHRHRPGKHNKKDIGEADATCPTGEPLCQYLPGKYECCKPGENCIPNVGCRC